jgi:hypothetical protein
VAKFENTIGHLAGTAKMRRFWPQRFLANAKDPRTAVPFLVAIVSLVFSFWLLPIQYVNPASVGWVFTRLPHMTDDSGHAIQAMFFGQEHWHWPPGRLVSFGGPFGASIIYAAVSPVLAFPAKLLEKLHVIGPYWQFVGMQGLLGICLTGVALYFLARALGASEIASGTAALLCLPLGNLFTLAVFNESLSWQFLAIIPMILLLNDKDPSQRLWPWPAVLGLAIWSNSYFAPMVLAFFVVHLWVIRLRYKTRLYDLVKQSLVVMLVAVVLQYLGGGFLISIRHLGSSTGPMDLFSVDLADFFHSQIDRQAYIYRGLTVLVLLLAWPCAALVQRIAWPDLAGRDKKAPRTKTTFFATSVTAAVLFVLALGPIIHFGTAGSLRLRVSELLLEPMVMFRAIGRFSWPLMYLLLGIAALAIDALVKTIPPLFVLALGLVIHFGTLVPGPGGPPRFPLSVPRVRAIGNFSWPLTFLLFWIAALAITALVKRIPTMGEWRRFTLVAFCVILVVSQFVEMYPELKRFRDVAGPEAAQVLSPNPALDAAVAASSEIEFVPTTDDPGGAPWPFLAYYAIKYKVPIYSYHWLGRANQDEVLRMRNLSTLRAMECGWTTDRVYAVKRSFLPQIEHCNYQMDELATYPDWVVLTLKQRGRPVPRPQAFSVASSSGGTWTLRLVYHDPDGASDIMMAQAVINTALSGLGACDLQVDPVHGYVDLLSDSSTAWAGIVKLGVAGTAQNSQCIVSGLGSSVTASGNTLTVNVELAFQPGFTGAKIVFENAINARGLNSGWINVGTWTVPPRR